MQGAEPIADAYKVRDLHDAGRKLHGPTLQKCQQLLFFIGAFQFASGGSVQDMKEKLRQMNKDQALPSNGIAAVEPAQALLSLSVGVEVLQEIMLSTFDACHLFALSQLACHLNCGQILSDLNHSSLLTPSA